MRHGEPFWLSGRVSTSVLTGPVIITESDTIPLDQHGGLTLEKQLKYQIKTNVWKKLHNNTQSLN